MKLIKIFNAGSNPEDMSNSVPEHSSIIVRDADTQVPVLVAVSQYIQNYPSVFSTEAQGAYTLLQGTDKVLFLQHSLGVTQTGATSFGEQFLIDLPDGNYEVQLWKGFDDELPQNFPLPSWIKIYDETESTLLAATESQHGLDTYWHDLLVTMPPESADASQLSRLRLLS